MARQWFVNGAQVNEDGEKEYFVLAVQISEDQAAAGAAGTPFFPNHYVRNRAGSGILVEEGYYELTREYFREQSRPYVIRNRRFPSVGVGGLVEEAPPAGRIMGSLVGQGGLVGPGGGLIGQRGGIVA